MTWCVAKSPRVVEQCDVNIHSLTHSGAIEDPPCIEILMHVKSIVALSLYCRRDVEVKRVGSQLWCLSRPLTTIQNYDAHLQLPLCCFIERR
ncbi:hypothetical protein TNCV_4858441 [Trichonephila clavipes]|nr:hypothetical protein TNCV_4858441 [Trichonephila clavipes]